MTDSLDKFQKLLRELFQFDCADLDFGIYQIMNYKRDVVERFITEDLPRDVAAELELGALAEQSQAAHELAEAREKVLNAFGDDVLDADGKFREEMYGKTKPGREYLAARAKASGSRGRDALEALIYNHLVAFFSHYYQDGDFISKRRYSTRQERYAIPYNGEEVTLYWANHDQYYVKTAEHFTDYTFTAPNGVTVHFKLQAADVEQNNVKGEKRFFLPRPAETSWDGDAAQLVIPFEFRPLTEQENITYGGKNQQEAILARALKDIPKRLTAGNRRARAGRTDRGEARDRRRRTGHHPGAPPAAIYAAQHVRLLHPQGPEGLPDARAGLLPEERGAEPGRDGGGRRGPRRRLVPDHGRHPGGRLPDHRVPGPGRGIPEAALGEAQVHHRDLLLRHGREHQPGVLARDRRLRRAMGRVAALFRIDDEQADLFDFDEDVTTSRAFLQAHPTLVVDTRHFDGDFVDRLLGSFDDVDEMTDGLLVHSENWQALNCW